MKILESLRPVFGNGGVAKWLGSALQKRLRRFEPGHHLQLKKP
jgi:hypothetical protein